MFNASVGALLDFDVFFYLYFYIFIQRAARVEKKNCTIYLSPNFCSFPSIRHFVQRREFSIFVYTPIYAVCAVSIVLIFPPLSTSLCSLPMVWLEER